MRLLWAQHSQEEDWGLILIDSQNAINEENQTAMFWDVRHEWPIGMQFTFNCYRNWATLLMRDIEEGSDHLLNSKEGVTQGGPLAISTYGILVLPLIKELQDAHPHVTQPWNAHDAGAVVNSGTSWNTSSTCKQGGHRGATSRRRPRLFWSCPCGTWQGQRSSSVAWV